MTEIYNEIKNRQKDNNSSGFDAEEFLKSLDIDKTQDIDNNFPDKTQPVVVEPQQIEPQRKSYFLQNSQKEINTTAQQPNEIEYEADIIDNPKNKDNYFGLTKLEKDKPSIFKAALESATKYNPLTAGVAVKNKLNEITGKNDIELSLEAGRGFAASGVDFGSAVYRFFKQNIDITKTYTKEQLDRIANKANVITYGKEKGDFSAKIDEKYNNFYKQIEEENKYLKDKTEKFLEYSGLAKDDNDSFVYDLAGGGASLLFALGLVALTKSPAAAAELFGAYQYQSLYEESIEKGFSPIKARSIGVVGGAAEAGLEMFGLHTLIETLKAKRSFAKVVKSFVIEATQEASQQTAEEMLAKWTGLRDSTAGQIWHNIWYAGIIGGILGGGAGAIGNIVVKATDELVANGADKQKAQKAVETVIEAALSQETADEIKQIDKDEQSPVTYTNADPRETYREFGDTVKNVLQSDQARGAEKKLLELKQSKYEERKKHYLEQGLSQDEAEKQAQAEATMYDVMARNRYESGEDLESIYNDIQIQQAKQEAANNGFDTTVPEIKQKWDDAKKIGGDSDTKYMNDNVIDGQYFLVEAETPTASHNPNANFQPTTGFPQTADGKTVNDRDYFNDKQAQAIVITTAQNYDSRAIDDMPIVSFEGVVVSGNQRTMASQLAAQNNTDGKYIEYLYNHCKKFGFSPEQVAEFKHPRVVFVPNESLDYDTQTFAAFNASEKKTQGSVEKAVSLGKRINDETIEQIANIIDKFDTLTQLHDSPKDIKEIVRILSKENIINNNELASLTDTTSAGDLKFSAIGKDFLENLLLGTALKEQTIRDLTHLQAIRAKLVKCILPLVKNKALPKEYQLQDDIEQATRILTAMKKENFKTIADFTAQQELFGSNIEYDKNIKKLAHLLTLKYSDIKSVLASYNQQAADNGAYGNSGLFGDSVQQTKNDILDDIFNNNKEFADVFFQQGYHGGGKDFDNFDLNFVLTGEGYNVHGWGVYVTANKKIAEDYRKRLSDHNSYHTFIYNGKKYTNKQIAQFKALSLFKQFGKKQALKTMNEILNNKEYWQYYGNDTKNIEAAIDLIKGIDRQSQIKETYGQTYKVDIPDNDVLLDEQKYFKEQPAKVQEALRKIGDNLTDEQIENLGYNSKEQKQVEAAKKFYKDMVFNNDYTGQGIYETITGLTGGDTKQASLLLKQYGIKGITYYGKIDGRGYVIFDDKLVKVIEKFYQPAYHGTPHKFDSFSTDKIGSGEGAAAHGWGLYFTENKDVADYYKFKLTPKTAELFVDPKDFTINDKEHYYTKDGKFYKNNYDDTNEKEIDKAQYSKALRKAQELNKKAIEEDNKQGQLLKVDIPEKDVLLDEQKQFWEQPVKVQEALKKIANKYYINLPVRGLWIYRQLVKKAPYKTETEKQKWASLILKQYGIKGITYDGRQDGRCYVIFDDKAINILETYYQNNQSPRGATTVYDRQYYVDLFSNSDKSTLMHELAHIYLADLNRLAKKVSASKKVRDLKEQIDLFLGEPENDGRYSTEQQEKFAINFESYLKNGQAPNAKLKNVFERFAKWLADIYDTIKDSLPTINNEVKSLFDKILSDSYFVPDSNIYGGKAEAIKKVIENIKQGINSEVDGITITDVERLLKVAYTRKPNKPSKNLLQLLKSKNIYDFNDLDKAGNKRVQEILKANGYIDDKVTEEQAVELAKAALDGKPVYRLADNWRTRSDTDFRRNLRILEEVIDFNDIDMVLAKIYDLQNAGYRQVEQQDVEQAKQAAQQVNSASLDNAKKIIKEVIEKIRRKQFIDSAAKKELLQDLESSQTIEEIRESVGNIIEDLQAEVDLIKDSIKTQRKPKIRKDKTIPPGKNATQEEKNAYKKYMKVRIDRLLKQALPRKQNQQKFSKFDVQTQRFFNNLQVWNNKTLVEIQQVLYDKAMNINDEQGEGLDNFSKIENMFLSYKAHKVTYHSVDFYKQLYDSLQEINVFGRNTKDIENTLKKEQALQDRQDLIDNIEKNKSSNAVTTGVKKQYIKWLGNWYSTINAIAGKGQAEKDSLEKIEIDIFNANYKKTEDVKEKCKNALGLKNTSDLDMVINNYLKEEYTYSETDAEGYTNNIKLNKMQLICCYIWLKNDTLKDRIIRAFGNMQVMDMINKLTLQDQKFGDELQQAVADLYDDINKVYLKMYGLDLPQAQNYFPSNVERIQGNMDLLKDNIAMVSSPGFIKARVDSHLPLMNFGNPVKIALDHIAKVNHFVYMQEKLAQLNKIYKATIVKRHIVNNYGDRVYAYILQVLDNAKFQTVARTIDGISDIGNYLVNNYVLTKIAIKPSIMIKQLLSCINYIEDIDSTKWFSGFLKGISSPKETIKFMMTNSKYCKARFEKGGQTEALLKAIEGQNATFAKVKTFKGMLSYMTRVGDIGAIIFGGYPMIQAQLEKGIDLKTAIENFEKATVRSQQASLPSTLSNWQYRGMNSWLYRAFFAFSNTPNQYCRKMADSMYMYYHGDIDKKQLAKNLMIYGVFNPLLYTSFTSLALLTGIVSGDWDDLADDIIMSLLQCSNVLALPFIAQGYNIFVSRVVAGKWLPDKEIPLLDNLVKIMKTYSKDELEFNDWLNITDEAGSLVLGVPVKTLYNEFVGSIKDLLDGEYGKFIVKVYGATESRANKIFD